MVPRVVSPSCTARLRAARFVKEARGCNSEIVVIKDGAQANDESSLKLTTLGAKHGDRLVIRAQGNEEEAAEAPVAVLSQEEEE